MNHYVGAAFLVRWLLHRGLALVYLAAFVSAMNQFRPLLGERGLLPTPRFVAQARFRDAPSLFFAHYSDRFFTGLALLGILLSLAAALGFTEAGPLWLSLGAWLLLWVLYLSIVNVGQDFYSFGWESMLLEAGFFASFLGPSAMAPSAIPVLALRWMLFRVELGAGLIKLRHDPCWRNLTCLYYHYETQPLPNPLSRHFHRLPKPIHRAAVVFSHFVQVVVPFGLFFPQPIASVAAGLTIVHQLLLIVSGNYAWLNWLTVVLGFSGLADSVVASVLGMSAPLTSSPRPAGYEGVLIALAIVTVALSVQPVRNLLSKRQRMNETYNPLRILGSYGAFGDVTRERYEVILEGTEDERVTDATAWKEYELKGKPGRVDRRPPQIAPYHLRLDWLLWFLPFSTMRVAGGVVPLGYPVWFMRLMQRLLDADEATLRLFRRDPFDGRQPRFVRARQYEYHFASRSEARATGAWWRRELVGEYLPAVSRQEIDRIGEDDSLPALGRPRRLRFAPRASRSEEADQPRPMSSGAKPLP